MGKHKVKRAAADLSAALLTGLLVMTRVCRADMGNPAGFAIVIFFSLLYFICMGISIVLMIAALIMGIRSWNKFNEYNREHPDSPIVHEKGKSENIAIILLIVLGVVFSLLFIGFLFEILAIIQGRRFAKKAAEKGVHQAKYDALEAKFSAFPEEDRYSSRDI